MRKKICLQGRKSEILLVIKYGRIKDISGAVACVSEYKRVSQGTEVNQGKDTLKNVGSGPLLQNSNR